MFQGLYVALVTPFTHEGRVNTKTLRQLVNFHAKNKTHGIVVCGTTGESAVLSPKEQRLVIQTVVEESSGRMKVVAGAGARSTQKTIENVKEALDAGADGALVVTPFYNRPGQEGLYRHFKKVAEECDIPLMLYNVPSRTGVDLLPDTVARLKKIPNIVAIKEARPDLDRITELVMKCGDEIHVLSGHDPNLFPALCAGARGVVSVIANLVPGDLVRLMHAYGKSDLESARKFHFRLFEICRTLAMDTNPIPIKTAMHLLGWEVGEVRLPLCPMNPDHVAALNEGLLGYGLKPVVSPGKS